MNEYFGDLGDVWKHLPLAEILRLNPPGHYWETHAGSASYPLTASPTRDHGALRFLEHAPREPALQECAYLVALQASPGVYPGSPMIAARAMGQDASYIFCDIDPESADDLRTAMAGLDALVVEGDGVSVIDREAQKARVDPADVLVLIDPPKPHERWTPNSRTALELAGWLAGSGYRVLFWYAFDSIKKSGWAHDEIGRLAPAVELWCGEALMPASYIFPDRSGAWGCGVLLANATDAEAAACQRLGQALERMSQGDILEGNDPVQLSFQVMG